MIPYKNLSGRSSVDQYQGKRAVAYGTGKDYIRVKFNTGAIYKYTYQSAGKDNVETMKILAEQGIGLNSFIKLNVDKMYETKQ